MNASCLLASRRRCNDFARHFRTNLIRNEIDLDKTQQMDDRQRKNALQDFPPNHSSGLEQHRKLSTNQDFFYILTVI